MKLALIAVALVLAVQACGSPTQPMADGYEDCTAGGLSGFGVEVLDSLTGQSLASSALLTWRAGTSEGTSHAVIPPFPGTEARDLSGPYGRPGTYYTEISVPGYVLWTAKDVTVRQGVTHCSVLETVHVIARLRRS